MKTSNKLLVGGLLTLVLLITGIHVALYAKYKNGHYTILGPMDKDAKRSFQAYPAVSVVSIRNLPGATILFGDQVGVENGKENFLRVIKQGDSLVIIGRENNGSFAERGRLHVRLPQNVTLSVFDSYLTFEKGNDGPATNPAITLHNSHAVFPFSRKAIRLGHVTLNAFDNSIATFQGHTEVGQLDVQLKNSSLEYNEGEIGQLSIVTDTASRFMLHSKHLLKAKVSSITNNP